MLLLMNLVCTLKLRPKNQCGGERLNIYCVSWFPKEMNVLQVRVDQRKKKCHLQDFKLRVNCLFLDPPVQSFTTCLNLNARWNVMVCKNSLCS